MIRERWGSTKSEALNKIAQVSEMADEARNRARLKLFRSQFVEEQKRIRAKRIRFALTIVGIVLLLGGLSYYLDGKIIRAQEQHIENIRRINLLASEALGSDGPAKAILVEGQIQKELQSADNPPELPIFEHIFLAGIRMLRGENPPEFPGAEAAVIDQPTSTARRKDFLLDITLMSKVSILAKRKCSCYS